MEKEIEGKREVWLERVKIHLENLLVKANKYNHMLRYMAHHYQTQNKICNIKVKQMKDKLKEIRKGKKGGDKLKILFDASLFKPDFLLWAYPTKFEQFWKFLEIFEFLGKF